MPGQNGVFGYGLEREEGVPDRTSHFAKFETESLQMDRPYEPDPNLDPSGAETEGDNLEASGSGSVTASPNSESWLTMRAHHHGFYEKTSPAAGVHLWELRSYDETNDTAVAHYLDSLFARVWRDQRDLPSEYNILGAKVTDFELTVDAHKHVMISHDLLFLRDRYMRNPTEAAVNAAYTGDWVARGHRRSGDESGADFAFRVSTAGAVGVAKIVFGKIADVSSITSAGAVATATTTLPHGFITGDVVTIAGANEAGFNGDFAVTVVDADTFTYAIADLGGISATGTITASIFSATEHLVTDGWLTVYRADDTTAGTRREPVQIRVTDQTGDVFTIGDTWRIAARSPKPVAIYSERPKLNGTELEIRFSLDGGTNWITRTIESFRLHMGQPREAKPGLGSKYKQTIGFPDQSKRWWEVSFDRTYVDRVFEQALVSNTTVSAYAKFFGAPIGATGHEDFAEFEMNQMKATGAGSGGISSPGDLSETVTLRSTGLCVERWQNTVASIVPV